MSTFAKKVCIACVGLFVVNLVGLWTVIYLDHARLDQLMAKQAEFSGSKSSIDSTKSQNKKTDNIDQSVNERVDKLESQQQDTTTRLDDLDSSLSDLESSKTTSGTTTSKSSQKEYTIYLGEGSTTNREWVTIQSTTLALDTSKYQHISSVYFEAGLSTNGGEAYAQLIDANTGAVFSNPQLMNNTPTPTWKSIKINLTPGNQMYVVQLKSSSGESAVLSGSRLRIVAD